MLVVEIKINEKVVKKFVAVREELFRGFGATHEYSTSMHVDEPLDSGQVKRDRYPMGRIDHRYSAGALSLAEKLLKLARKKGMHK
jgi:hypothetical protein